ncbi:hypothetical protein [Microbacterium sp. NPDC056569]|uniref:hypothetical protein n=1 Tax=Microbacterium sp. NPDC056569 TaxID=3345867 RepID=UPI00366A75BB
MMTRDEARGPAEEVVMLETSIPAVRTRRPELLWVGSGAWVACDPSVDATDPHRAVAYLECKDDRVYVLWVAGSGGVCEFESISEALEQIAQRLAPAAI